ncbi:hypothetical protein G7066_13115 [Leucobacter coleopterorum]|uniref:Large extracellular alpha-helical protein n=1 Tax=Leucobacter coleopterorum TaxID=2714933 RepID=A0ABX6JY71_9MICO|nr:DUF5719 family protein [Leucobacter coleopterorum]QIM19269.1 hypothetical protein G7066_13115 [Leucobacter coleopterorum]
MTSQPRAFQATLRAIVGLAIVGVAAGAVVFLGNTTLPSVTRAPLAIKTDTTQNTERTLVCAGSFAELGADSKRPGVAIPTNAPAVSLAGTASDTSTLARAEGGEGLPQVFRAPTKDPLGAAQVQRVKTDALRGLAASACTEPLNEQWVLGGATGLGVSSTLSLGNPGEVPATVQITVFDEKGKVADGQTAGVLVSPGTEQTISLNGYAPDRERIAVRVVSTGAPVTASMGVAHVTGLDPYAVDTVTRQAEPATKLVVPGITNVSDHEHGAGDVGEADLFSVLVRVLAPGGEVGTAHVTAIDGKGKSFDLGDVQFAGSGVGELLVEHWPEAANAVIIEADAPILAGVMGSAKKDADHDYSWFVPAPTLDAQTPVAVPMVAGGKLIVTNTGDEEVEVKLVAASGKPVSVKVPAGAAVVQNVKTNIILTSTGDVTAGVRITSGGDIAGYPVQASDARDGALLVYPR